jgi:uracil DNA glycosylase
MKQSNQLSALSYQRAASTAPSLSEFFDESPSAEPAPASADYDFFGDSHFTAAHD